MALATPNQLWRLNKLGRLTLVDVGMTVEGMDHRQADEAIKQSLGTPVELGLSGDGKWKDDEVLPVIRAGDPEARARAQ